MNQSLASIDSINYRFSNPDLLKIALTHKSSSRSNYERLEFLGDSVLNFVVSDRLYQLRPEDNEGSLSRLRSRVVRGETLAKIAKQLGIHDHLIMGSGELNSGGFLRDSILADALESVIGAIFLDGGFAECQRVVLEIFDPVMNALPDAESLKDPKTRLQELLQSHGRPLPEYELFHEEGADHAKKFHVRCVLTDIGHSETALGSSRRKAEQAAALLVWTTLTDTPEIG